MSKEKTKSHSTPHRQSQGGKDFRKRVQRSKSQADAPAAQPASKPRTGNPSAKPSIMLKAGREKSLQRRHPWIFSGAVECIDGAPASGDTVPVRDACGEFPRMGGLQRRLADHRARMVVARKRCHRQSVLPQPHRQCAGRTPRPRSAPLARKRERGWGRGRSPHPRRIGRTARPHRGPSTATCW